MSCTMTAFRTMPQGKIWGWLMPWSAQKMMDRQCQTVDVPVYAGPTHDGLPQKRLEEDLCRIIPHVHSEDKQTERGLVS